jgi:hypothetical protein
MNVRIRIDGLSGVLGILLGSAPAQTASLDSHDLEGFGLEIPQ